MFLTSEKSKMKFQKSIEGKPHVDMTESIRLGTILTLCGGFLDAYSYLVRGGVFANAITGNIVLTGLNLAQRNWGRSLYCFIPVLAYAAGVFMAELIHDKLDERTNWKEAILWLELLILLIAGFLPQSMNALVNFSIAFVCAMQVEAFRKIRGKAYATTMCTGNLRSGTELLSIGFLKHDPEKKKLALHYYWIDFVFCVGAIIGYFVCSRFAEKAIWSCAVLLFFAILVLKNTKRTASRKNT